MKISAPLLLALAIYAVSGATPGQAQTYPWCAVYSGTDGDGGTNCGFATFQQCQATIAGIGGWCEQNPRYSAPRERPHAPRSAR